MGFIINQAIILVVVFSLYLVVAIFYFKKKWNEFLKLEKVWISILEILFLINSVNLLTYALGFPIFEISQSEFNTIIAIYGLFGGIYAIRNLYVKLRGSKYVR